MAPCNETLEHELISEVPYAGSLTFHQLGLIVSATFALIATCIACILMLQHALHYSRPWEQKHIIRILFMIPIYSLVSFLSYYYYTHAIYWETLRDCYEAFAIASFFTLLCNYLAPTVHDQKEYFRSVHPKNWHWLAPPYWFQGCFGGPTRGCLRMTTSGLTWFNIMWVGVFQYCFIRVLFTIVAVLSQATGRYCQESLSPAFAHIWVQIFEGIAVTVAMMCIIQFYYQIHEDIVEHKPFLKILCIKLVIFFSFWQNLFISFAATKWQASPKISLPDVRVGIPSMLLCIEMAIFAVMHIFAFPSRPYSLKGVSALTAPGAGFTGQASYHGGPLGIYAFADAFNPWDIIKAAARGFRWLFVGRRTRHQDPSYKNGPIGGGPPVYGQEDVYSSTKLGPVNSKGPTPLQRDRHLSVESDIDRERRSASGSSFDRQRSHSNTPNGGHGPDAGDIGAMPTGPYLQPGGPYDTSYRPHGHDAYYGDELPPAPVPYDRNNPYGEDLAPYDAGGPHGEDRAALLSNAGSAGGRGGASHQAFRRA